MNAVPAAATDTDARRIGGCALLATALSVSFALACASPSSSGVDSHRADGGITSFQDAGASVDVGPIAPQLDGGAEADRTDPGAYAAACLDGRDENHSGGVDCSDTSCQQAASCCVGSSRAGCCTIPGVAIDLHFVCSTGSCDTLSAFTTFGDVGPVRASDGAFVPESDHGGDSGAILASDLDPRASILSITASLGVPSHTADVDAVAIGLVSGGPSAHVVPLASIVVSAARGQVLLLLGEQVAGAATAPGDELLHDYTLTVDPTGLVTATGPGTSLTAMVTLPSAPVHAAFFGRASNPGSSTTGLPARIGSLRVSSTGCDQPAALTRMGAITIIDHTGAAILSTASDPSLASNATSTVLAFTAATMSGSATAIFVATRESDGAYHVRAPSTGTQPLLAPPAGDAFESPALVFDTVAGTWSLFGTRVHAGARSIFVATSSSADVLSLGAPTNIHVDLTGDVSSPAPVPQDPSRLVVRHVADPTGDVGARTAELVLLMLDAGSAVATPMAGGVCGADSSCLGGARAQTHLYAARTMTISFDADDVNDPAIVLYDHVYRLYYAGRLGSRWSIGMLIAADLGYWRAATDGTPILAPTGNGLDAVSVRDPAPLVEDGRLSLYYVGDDGDARTIALAAGSAIAP